MFDIGWSEIVVIAVVALIAIGPKELPGVLRMVGQWMGKARKMAAEFQGQFQEAMREAEMADLKKSFDEVKEAASGFASGNLMTSLEKDVSSALRIDDVDKPAASKFDAPAASGSDVPAPVADTPVIPTTPVTSSEALATSSDAPQAPVPETFTELDAQALAAQPLAIVQEAQAQPVPQDTKPATTDVLKDAKAS
jgi:sec-independent protein translocase protein TatB